ncbi:aldose 1-epimerase family protein [Arthrobacter sp. D1-17]
MTTSTVKGTPATKTAAQGRTEFELRHGGYVAAVTLRGAALRSLRHGGRNLVVPFEPGIAIPDYRGVICAPWPNRLAGGRYSWKGADIQVPINEPGRNTALHGLVFDKVWSVAERDESSVTLAMSLTPGEGYPFPLELRVRYCLSAAGLQGTVTAANPGSATVPYGVCPHPYLIAGSAPLDDWSLVVPADRFLRVTPDRLLPVEEVSVEGHNFDFRKEKVLGGVKIDHAFTGISRDTHGTARVCVYDPSGTGVELAWGREWPWVQVHTGDKPSGPDRLGVAVEPMTCPPDAFNSGRDVVQLAPGQEHAASWSIRTLQRLQTS